MNKLFREAEITPKARGMVMGRNSCPNGKSVILRLHDPSANLVSEDVRRLLIHVPGHQLAGTEAGGLGLNEQAPGRTNRHGSFLYGDLSALDVSR